MKWSKESGAGLAHESAYPYRNTNPTLTCPANLGGLLIFMFM